MFPRLYVMLLVWKMTFSIREVAADKRLVLHSDDDVIQKLVSLEQDVQGMKAEVHGMKTELAAKDQVIAMLNQTLDQKSALLTTLEQTLQGVQSELAAKTLDISTLQQSISLKANAAALGSTFVRWGRTTCAGYNSSQLVYKGIAAGPLYAEKGNGANMICLPEHPTWAQFDTAYTGAHIFGAEYGPGFKAFNFQHYEDMPCSVCRTHLSSTIMMPASTQCNAGWTMQYTGYLMASRFDRGHSADYICVDEHPEALYHGEQDLPSPEMFVVQAKCGSLPCQVYPDGKQLACSVCSQ